MENIFTHIYDNDVWRRGTGCEPKSGSGSTLESTVLIRESLIPLCKNLNVKTFIDAPCGDFYWMQHVFPQDDIQYIGFDIVKKCIDENQRKFGRQNIKFQHKDVVYEELPKGDVIFSRDFIQHLSIKDVELFFDNFIGSEIKYILLTSFESHKHNIEIKTGGYRPINLLLEPFSFPVPLKKIKDVVYGVNGKIERYLYLYERNVLKDYI